MDMYEALYLGREDLRARRKTRMYPIVKRGAEVILAIVLLIAISPLLLALAVLIVLDSPGSVFFRQIRIGKDGKPFKFYKFRSMYTNIDRSGHEAFLKAFVNGHAGEGAEANEHQDFKPIKVNQVTGIGRLLRKTSMDELPQVFNIIKGDMSFIGPRPNVPAEVGEYKDWHKRRLGVLPGITGLAQINGRSKISFDQIVRYDLEYVENESLVLDLQVLWRTVPAVLKARGAR